MKRLLALFCLLTTAALSMSAQIAISYDMVQRNMNINVKLTLKDSKTSEPISWASVYLIPQGDTTITHFALSDEKGDVELDEVPTGKYELNAEIIGYKPHKKVYTFKNWREDLGIIKMEQDAEYLDAASVSAVGNPITVKQDTIEFNASSFKVGENAMLEDLLKKMPGMEVSEDGTVTVNGETVDKITVGGKTFFFNEPGAALKNLPAKLVDKVKVIDKDSEEAEFSGIATKEDKEKVMDIELKEEYTKGWFGNAKLGGGSTLPGKDADELTDDLKALYNGNAMATGYTEKDQFVFIGNAYNATEPGAEVIYYYSGFEDDQDAFTSMGGLISSAQAGINYNTERIPESETSASVTYKHTEKDAKTRSARTSFQAEGPDLQTDGTYDGKGADNTVSISLQLEDKEKKDRKFSYYLVPQASFSSKHVTTTRRSSTYGPEGELNSSSSSAAISSEKFSTSGYGGFGYKDFGKKRRSISLFARYGYSSTDAGKKEISEVVSAGSAVVKDLFYDTDNRSTNASGTISYVEPFGERWAVQTRFSGTYSGTDNRKDAYNTDGSENAYYSSLSDSRYLEGQGRLLLQWDNDTTSVQAGVQVNTTQNVIKAKSLGAETLTGKGEWLTNWSPFVNYSFEKEGHDLWAGYYGRSSQVSGSRITPTIDISNPVQIQAGNIYLKPSFSHDINLSYRMNNRETFSFLSLYIYGGITTRSVVDASWFDPDGIRYAVPVNSLKPQSYGSLYASFNQPLGKERRFTLALNGSATYTSSTGYQAASGLEGLDIQHFDYNDFMKEFWGDASGDRFYSGESGFGESRTNTFSWWAQTSLKFSVEKLDATVRAYFSNNRSRYSLDPTADMNTWRNNFSCNLLYTPGKEWEVKSDLSYIYYRGYTAGYGRPEWKWDMSVSKSIKSVTLSLKAADILNQTRNLRRTTSSEYSEDVYSNVMGRFFLFSVSFSFGKMNSKKNSNVENAMWNMM